MLIEILKEIKINTLNALATTFPTQNPDEGTYVFIAIGISISFNKNERQFVSPSYDVKIMTFCIAKCVFETMTQPDCTVEVSFLGCVFNPTWV